MKKDDLYPFAHVKCQYDDDPELEEGAIISLGSKMCIVAGIDAHKGFWAPIPYEDIIEIIPPPDINIPILPVIDTAVIRAALEDIKAATRKIESEL